MSNIVYSTATTNKAMSKTALVIIDIQNDYFKNGAFELVGSDQASLKAKQILRCFRDNGAPVFHVQHLAAQSDAPFFIPDTQGAEIHDNVKPIEGEAIVIKHFPNSFRNTDLLPLLKEQQIENVVIVGMMTHMCIDATTRAAKDLGFNCTVISDACATRDLVMNDEIVTAKNVHNSFLSALSYFYANILDTDAYLKSVE